MTCLFNLWQCGACCTPRCSVLAAHAQALMLCGKIRVGLLRLSWTRCCVGAMQAESDVLSGDSDTVSYADSDAQPLRARGYGAKPCGAGPQPRYNTQQHRRAEQGGVHADFKQQYPSVASSGYGSSATEAEADSPTVLPNAFRQSTAEALRARGDALRMSSQVSNVRVLSPYTSRYY